jgi:hypothetical protein
MRTMMQFGPHALPPIHRLPLEQGDSPYTHQPPHRAACPSTSRTPQLHRLQLSQRRGHEPPQQREPHSSHPCPRQSGWNQPTAHPCRSGGVRRLSDHPDPRGSGWSPPSHPCLQQPGWNQPNARPCPSRFEQPGRVRRLSSHPCPRRSGWNTYLRTQRICRCHRRSRLCRLQSFCPCLNRCMSCLPARIHRSPALV